MNFGVEIAAQGPESVLTMLTCASSVYAYLSDLNNWKLPIMHSIDSCPQLTFEALTGSGQSIRYRFN